jgi:hypothetical protein
LPKIVRDIARKAQIRLCARDRRLRVPARNLPVVVAAITREAAPFLLAIGRDRHGNVIAGHGRLLATQELDGTEVPTVCLDHLTPAQARTFRIADNISAQPHYREPAAIPTLGIGLHGRIGRHCSQISGGAPRCGAP